MKLRKKYEEMMDYMSVFLLYKGFSIKNTSDENRLFIEKNSKKYGVTLCNYQIPQNLFLNINNKNISEFGSNFVIFYKDGSTFYRRMINSSSYRFDKSLKNYSQYEINKIMRLSLQERLVLVNFNQYFLKNMSKKKIENNILRYYQPKTKNFQEGIKRYESQLVYLDYSHIDSGDRRNIYLPKERIISKTYFFLNEV